MADLNAVFIGMKKNAALIQVLVCLLTASISRQVAAAEPSPLDSIRAAIRADIAEQKSHGKGKAVTQRVEVDEEALSDLDSSEPRGSDETERSVKNIAGQTDSDKVRRECEAFLRNLRAQEAERTKQFAISVENTIRRTSELALKAQNARDLDGPIAELRSIIDHTPYGDETSDRYAIIRRLDRARETAQHWQDYLSERDAGNAAAAKDALQHLADEQQGGLDVPRSEILARIHALEPEETKQIEAQGRAILESIHSLDDVAGAIVKLRALRFPRSGRLVGIINNLEPIARTYEGLKQGIATTLTLSSSRPGDSDPLIVRLHGELLLLALPRFLHLPDTQNPRPGETIDTYLRRIADQARAASDWDLLGRILYARKQITLHTAGVWSSDTLEDYSAFLYFEQARVQERARQYASAVALYQSALRQGGVAVPAEIIGERLEAIRKEHPAEFEEGMKSKRSPAGNVPPDHPGAFDRPDAIAIPGTGGPVATTGGTASPSPSQSK